MGDTFTKALDEVEQAREERKAMLLMDNFFNGELTYEQYRNLPKHLRTMYVRTYERPLSPMEKKAKDKKNRRAIAKKKAAKLARKRNRK